MTALRPSRIQRVRHELKRRQLTVLRVARPTPGFAAVTFGGDALGDFVSLSFDDHVKFMFDDAAGQTQRRDYTPRAFDAQRRELTLEFALHGHGPAADWARQAAVGQVATLGGPRGSMIVPMDFGWHLLAGDASALPAVHRRLLELPAGSRVRARLLVADAADQRSFDGCVADLDLQWFSQPADWLQALATERLPAGDGFAWAAGEARQMAQVRQAWLDQGHPKADMRVAAYWKQGASDFHDRLEG